MSSAQNFTSSFTYDGNERDAPTIMKRFNDAHAATTSPTAATTFRKQVSPKVTIINYLDKLQQPEASRTDQKQSRTAWRLATESNFNTV